MSETHAVPRSVPVIRWIARIWSGVVFALAILEIVYPDPYATEPVPAADWFLLSLWGVAILGLAAAWRWEAIGAMIAIVTMFLREAAFFLLKGFWHPAFLIIWILIVPPAIMFLAAWGLTRKVQRAGPPKPEVP
ncbi:MAG: hypothetical protein AB1531_09795 [Chloroflexota bacterium]